MNSLDISGTELLLRLGRAVCRNKLTLADLDWLIEDDHLAKFRPVIKGNAEIRILRHVIDLSDDPYVPPNWTGVEEHRRGDATFEWNPDLIAFYLSKEQGDGKRIKGCDLRKELVRQPVFNSNLLDYLLENPTLIPESWKKNDKEHTRYISFWGTVYRGPGGFLCIRCLYWRNGRWRWIARYLSNDQNSSHPTACLADPA